MNDPTRDILYPLLKHDEKLLWTGVSEPGFRWRMGEYIVMGMGVLFVGVPLAPVLGGGAGLMWLAFFALGVLMLFFGAFTGWFVRRNSRYALSDQRAFLIFNHPVSGVQVKSYPMKPVMSIEKLGKPPASVYFTNTDSVDIQGVPMHIGFALIKDADEVFDLMRGLQQKLR